MCTSDCKFSSGALARKPIFTIIPSVRSPIASKAPYRTAITSLAFAAAARLIRRWNQTGQKFAGAPDIAGAFLPHHPRLLWTLILITYLDCFRGIVARQKSRFGSTALAGAFTVLAAWTTLSGFVFKLAFTAADSPELLDSRVLRFAEAYSGRVSLVTQARIVFSGIMALGAMYMFANRRGHDLKPAIGKRNGHSRRFCFIANPDSDTEAQTPSRMPIPIPYDAISRNQRPPISPLPHPSLGVGIGPFRLPRDHHLVSRPAAHVVLRLRRLKRHLFHRSVQRVQRSEQLQRRHRRPAHVPEQLGRRHLVGVSDATHSVPSALDGAGCSASCRVSHPPRCCRRARGDGLLHDPPNASLCVDRVLAEAAVQHGMGDREPRCSQCDPGGRVVVGWMTYHVHRSVFQFK